MVNIPELERGPHGNEYQYDRYWRFKASVYRYRKTLAVVGCVKGINRKVAKCLSVSRKRMPSVYNLHLE